MRAAIFLLWRIFSFLMFLFKNIFCVTIIRNLTKQTFPHPDGLFADIQCAESSQGGNVPADFPHRLTAKIPANL